MRRKNNIVEKFLSLIKARHNYIDKGFEEAIKYGQDLETINKASSDINSPIDIDKLLSMEEDDFQKVLSLVVKGNEEELISSINASRAIHKLGVDLVAIQQEKLKELSDRIDVKKRSLQRMIKNREEAVNSLELSRELVKKLEALKETGFVNVEIVDQVFKLLNIKEIEQDAYLSEVLRFNETRFTELQKINSSKEDQNVNSPDIEKPVEEKQDEKPNTDEKIENSNFSPKNLEVNIVTENSNVSEPEKTVNFKMSFEELEKIIKDNGYDISFLNKQLIDELMEKGTIAKISTIFNSIKNNKLDFLIDDKKNAKLLVQYLLHSEPEMISKTCDYLKAHGILNERYVKAYKSLFFQANTQPSDSVSDDIEVQKATHKYQHTKDSDDVKIVGRHNDFFKNIEILKILGYDDDSELIENNVKLLTMSNKAVLRHVKELQLYDYPIGSDTFPLSAINASRIMELSDRFIELGEENYILRYASRLLAYVDGTLERLYALKAKGLPYHTKYGNEDKLLSYVTNLKLSCHLTQEQIDEAIPKDVDILLNGNKYSNLLNSQLPATISDETLADSMIENIENRYKETNWHYNFNGVIISRKKLLRNYEFLKNTEMLTDEEKNPNQMLFVSAINNSTLNSEQIEKVSNALMDKLEIGGNNGISKK